MSDGEWRLQAKCRGRADEWSISSLRFHPDKDAGARRKCAGCRVLIDCAALVYANPDTVGIIAAGQAIEGDSCTPEAVRERLAALLDIEYVSAKMLRAQRDVEESVPCPRCGHKTVTATTYRLLQKPSGTRRRNSKTGLCENCDRADLRKKKKEMAA